MRGVDRGAIVLVFLVCSGCAARQPSLQTWRLVKQGAGQVLIPPDVTAPDIAQRTFTADDITGYGPCPSAAGVIAIRARGRHMRVTVTRDSLAKQPTGWLGEWASQLEAQGCVSPGDGMKLAARIAESVPLEPAAAVRLLYADDRLTGEVDIGPQTRLEVVSPLWRDPKLGLMADGPFSISGSGYSLTITGKSTENLLGYERALYAVVSKSAAIGYTIVPRYANLHIQGKTERRPRPVVNYFQFPPGAAFYRIFYKSEQNDFTALVIAAHTPAELDQRTKILQASGAAASCQDVKKEMCVAIPSDAGLNWLISVTVNGAEVLVPRGGKV